MSVADSPRRRRMVMAVGLLCSVVVMLAVTGCAKGVSSGPSAAPSMLATSRLDSREWGFSLQHPVSWAKVEPSVDRTANPGLLYQLYVADPAGAKADGAALDVLGLSIHQISKASKSGDLQKHRAEFQAMATQLIGRPGGLTQIKPFELARLGGLAGLTGEYAYRANGEDVAVVAYLLPRGDRVYWVTGQASRKTWTSAGRMIASAMSTLEFR